MTQKEFEERTGLKMTDQEFNEEVNPIYMDTDIDKDMFCELWKKHPSALMEIKKQTKLVRMLIEERKKMTDFLIDEAHKMSSPDARSMAISLLGQREYLKISIAKGYNLWEVDKEDLVEILSK